MVAVGVGRVVAEVDTVVAVVGMGRVAVEAGIVVAMDRVVVEAGIAVAMDKAAAEVDIWVVAAASSVATTPTIPKPQCRCAIFDPPT